MDVQRFVARRAAAIETSGIRRMFELSATLKDPINFSIGQPDFDVDPPAKQAAIEAIQAGRNGYTVTQGAAPLREAIRERLRREFPDWEFDLLVTCGVSGGLTLAMLACLNPGDAIVFMDPYFVVYTHLATMLGVEQIHLDGYPDFRLRADRLEAAITPRTKAILLNSPGNPTGVVFTEDELRAAADIARRRDLLIITDEIYCDLVYDGPCPSVVRYAPERTILLRGFAKGYGMTGWRLGYAAGPPPLITEMTKLQQYTFVCAPSPLQYGALAALSMDISHHVADYRRKRDLICARLAGCYEFARPAGGFYVFPRVPPRFEDATRFCEQCLQHNLLITPGRIFSGRDTHFRISYAAPDDKIEAGCEVLRRLAD